MTIDAQAVAPPVDGKLAAEIRGSAGPGLLDSYETERRQAALRMIMNAQAQSALIAPGSDVSALRELFGELLGHQDTVQHLADLVAGTDIRYDLGGADAHPLVGRFAPDLDLRIPTGKVRLAELTRPARPLLLDLTDDGSSARAAAPWRGRVDIVPAQPAATDPAATALLLRPDCYVAWASDAAHPEPAELEALRAALRRWFGPAD